jgi:hypothetical protein
MWGEELPEKKADRQQAYVSISFFNNTASLYIKANAHNLIGYRVKRCQKTQSTKNKIQSYS